MRRRRERGEKRLPVQSYREFMPEMIITGNDRRNPISFLFPRTQQYCRIIFSTLTVTGHIGLNGIPTHDLCDTGAVLYQLSYPGAGHFVSL